MDLRLPLIVLLYLKLGDTGKCPIDNCRHCPTTDECSVCMLGWFGKKCEHICRGNESTCSVCSDSFLLRSPNLHNETICFGCKRNEYVSRGECRPCKQNCRVCSGLNDCKECNAGYFGQSCQYKCPANCKSCLSDTSCTTCNDEWQGVSCQCSPNCLRTGKLSEWCGKNGTCEIGCMKGKRGSMCDLDCDKNDVCIECDQFKNRCLNCTNGWHGRNCDKQCGHCSPDDKGNIACDIESGECNSGCTHGYFDSNCDKECSPGCHGPNTNSSSCDTGTGECIFGCIPGMYGEKCDKNCSVHCSNNTCYQRTGQCNNGCPLGWYGLNCTYACNNTCLNQLCNVSSGYCDIGCEPGWYGDSCQHICNMTCANQSCARHSGLCDYEENVEGDDIVGTYILKGCIGKCKNNTCNRQTSWCLNGCQVGYEGPYCNKTMEADFGALVILTNSGIAAVLIVLSFFSVACLAIRYALCLKPRRRRQLHISNRENIESVYDNIRENADEMAILTNCMDGNSHFDTIADSVHDVDSWSRKGTSKDEHYGTLTNKKHRYNEYTDLTYLTVNNSRTFVPRLPPRNESPNTSNYVIEANSKNIGSVFSKDITNGQYRRKTDIDEQLDCLEEGSEYNYPDMSVRVPEGRHKTSSQIYDRIQYDGRHSILQLKPSPDMTNDHCDYLHPVC